MHENQVFVEVRVQHAFKTGMKGKGNDVSEEDEDEFNHMAIIHELPRSPRFSTFLSPEAQFAMMKGYEDKLYEKIADDNPDCRITLKRNKTPHQRNISIIDNYPQPSSSSSVSHSPDLRSDSPSNKSVTSSGYGSSMTTSSTPLHININNNNRAFSPEASSSTSNSTTTTTTISRISDMTPSSSSSSTLTVPTPSPFLKPLRRQSCDVNGNHDGVGGGVGFGGFGHPQNNNGIGEGWALQRSNSLPVLDGAQGAVLSHQKRLIMSHRLESAMDILDTLKQKKQENALSPRVCRLPRHGDAARDFNSWTKVWKKEFKEGQPAK